MPPIVSTTMRIASSGSRPWAAPASAKLSATSAMNAGPQLISAIAGSISGSSASGITAPARPIRARISSSGPSAARGPGT